MAKNFVPDNYERLERRKKKQLHILTNGEEKELALKIKGKISFYSYTLTKIRPDTVATTFIVHTHKPMRWIDFIAIVGEALAEVL